MKTKKINLSYFRIYKEIVFFLALKFSDKKTDKKSNRTLIISPCLVGEARDFLLALHDYIERHKDEAVDVVVSPALQPLAERVAGIEKVFVANSVHKEDSKNAVQEAKLLPPEHYNKKIILRMSRDSYFLAKNVLSNETETGLIHFIKYVGHLFKNIVLRRTPKQWREVNFEMLDGIPKNFKFEEIFHFREEDYEKLRQLDILNTPSKKIIIHTNCDWPMKKWDRDKWVELLKKINRLDNFSFIFIGAKEDEDDYAYISSKLDFKTYSLIGKTDLAELLLVMRKSDYFIGIDSGPQNIAQLAGLKSIIIFGPGPHMHMPSDGKSIAIDKSRGRGFYQTFFLKKNNFIGKIGVEEVFDAFCRIRAKQE